MADITEFDPFIWCESRLEPLPYLLAKCDLFDVGDPVVHDVKEVEEGFVHRIVWKDNTGIFCASDDGHIPPSNLAKIYKAARCAAEELEFYASGSIVH